MKIPQDRIKELTKDFLTPFFKENGFRKSGNRFYKPVNDFSYIIEMQSSRFNSKEEAQFTFNVSLYIHQYFRHVYNAEPPNCPTNNHNLVPPSKRSGHICEAGDKWYTVNQENLLIEVAQEIIDDFNHYVIPYFEQFQNIDDIIQYGFESMSLPHHKSLCNPIQFSMLLLALGRKTEAEQIFRDLWTKNSDRTDPKAEEYLEWLEEMAANTGINIPK